MSLSSKVRSHEAGLVLLKVLQLPHMAESPARAGCWRVRLTAWQLSYEREHLKKKKKKSRTQEETVRLLDLASEVLQFLQQHTFGGSRLEAKTSLKGGTTDPTSH